MTEETKKRPVADVAFCDQNVEILIAALTRTQTTAQGYRNLAYAMSILRARLAEVGNAARRARHVAHYRKLAAEADARAADLEAEEEV